MVRRCCHGCRTRRSPTKKGRRSRGRLRRLGSWRIRKQCRRRNSCLLEKGFKGIAPADQSRNFPPADRYPSKRDYPKERARARRRITMAGRTASRNSPGRAVRRLALHAVGGASGPFGRFEGKLELAISDIFDYKYVITDQGCA